MRQDKPLHYWHYFFMGFVDDSKNISPALSTQGAERPKTIKSATYLQQNVSPSLHQTACLRFHLLHWATYPLCAFAGKETSCPTVFVWAIM